MLEKLIEQLLALGWLKELTLDEVLERADGTVIITADILYRSETYNRLSIQEITLDFQSKDELQLLKFIGDLETRFFISMVH
jgi:hypothetical protein